MSVQACVRAPIRERSQALREVSHLSRYSDDLDYLGLYAGLKKTAEILNKKPEKNMAFGPYTVSAQAYAEALNKLADSLDMDEGSEVFQKILREDFLALEVYGTEEGWGQVFVTSYFTPEIKGTLKRTKKFSAPVLSRPKDMVKVPLREFIEDVPDGVVRDGHLRGRVEASDEGVWLKPYYDRGELRSKKFKKSEVLAYADPVDLFFLQIQGSGKLRISSDKTINLNYADQNGHPYYPIGRALKDVIPVEEMSLQSIEAHLRNLPLEEQIKILDLNKSYVFFTKSDSLAVTAIGLEAQPGRTMATDARYFPKGALAYLEYPGVDPGDKIGHRFTLDHDNGGAIRGPGRVDLYWGVGDLAEDVSGRMKGMGRLVYFVPKAAVIQPEKGL